MKKVLVLIMFLFSILNANEKSMSSILTNILKVNLNKTIEIAKIVKQEPNSENFYTFIAYWKSVEATYIGGDLNEDVIDTPRLIDIYHNSNEDIKEQLKKIMQGKEKLEFELFKNSFKSVNALEYLLFSKDSFDKKRREDAIEIVIDNIIEKLYEIKDVYDTQSLIFEKDEKWAYSMITNALISSIYKLKEWRIGEPAGLISKYKDNPNNNRSEYTLSMANHIAIKSIINTHSNLFSQQPYENIYSYASKKGYKNEVDIIKNTLEYAKTLASNITNNFEDKKFKELYSKINEIQKLYQELLIISLNIPMKIVDADGD